MIFKKGLMLALSALFLLTAHSQAQAGLTRNGNTIGIRNAPVTHSLDYDMRAQGVPDQCRKEAHQVLGKYIVYGYQDDPKTKARFDIICKYTPTPQAAAPSEAKGFANKKLGQAGKDQGLAYIRFRNETGKDIERFMYNKPGVKEVLECRRNGVCIRLSDGGRTTVLDTTQGPLTVYVDPATQKDKKSEAEPQNRGGMFAMLSPSKRFADPSIIKVATPNVVQGGGRLSSEYGHRESPRGVGSTNHKGIDIAAANGTNILAYAQGTVVTNTPASQSGGRGNYVVIQHADGTLTEYFHMATVSPISKGSTVSAGQTIGQVGSTGHSTGNHLHFGAYKLVNGQKVYMDPLTMTAPTGALVTQSASDLAAIGAQIAAVDSEQYTDGGAAGDMLDNADVCATGVSVLPCSKTDE